MLDKDLYDSWKSRMELYMQNREHGRKILELVEHGPLIWPTVKENGVIRTKKYAELSAAEKIQADCDMKATNIIFQGLPANIYSLLINDMNIYKMKMEQFQVNTKFLNSLPPEWSKFVTDVKLVKDLHTSNFDQLHAYLEQHELHVNEVCIMRERNQDPLAFVANQQMTPPHFNTYQSPYNNPQLQQHFSPSQQFPTTNNQLKTSSNPRNQATIQDGRDTVQQVQGRQGQNYSSTTYKGNATSSRGNTTSGQSRVVKCYNCQGVGHMARQCTQPKRTRNAAWYKEKAMLAKAQEAGQILDEEQLAFLTDLGIQASQAQTVIPHNVAFQTEDLDTYDSDCDALSTAQAVLMDNISNYGSDVILEVPNSKTYLNDMDNQSVHALQDFEQTPVMDFTDNEISGDSNIIPREKMIDSQMDDMIKVKLALKEKVDSLEQNLSKQIKEKESLLQTFNVFKNESKEKENKYQENEIDLEKKIKELDNIVYKVGQSTQTVHMLTKPQSFYDNIHKQALGYQNLFYLKKAQRIKPTLYDGCVISKKHDAMLVVDDEETLILEEESRSKMSEKAKDPEAIKQNISHKPIDYEKLNRLTEDFGKRFSPQQELSAEQAFWFRIVNPSIEPSYTPPVIVDVPSELPKVSLVNASLKKLKFHLTQFNSVVRKRTTPSALEEGEWGFKDTKTVFNNEIIPFLKSLKDIFNVFDKDLLNEITEVQTVFDQMDAAVQQSSVDKQCLEIAKKEILLENDRLLQKIMSQDVFKDQFDSIKQTRVRHKEQCDSLINKLNLKSVENEDLKAQIQDKVFVITSLKNNLRELKGKEIVENVIHTPSATTIALGMFKLDLEPLPPMLLQNREVHITYLRNTQEQANILWEIVEQAKAKQPLDSELDLACKYATRIQELLVYVQDTCPNAITPSAKKVTVKPMNNVKKVRFVEPLTSSSKIQQVESSNTSDSNTLVLSSTGVKCSTSNCGSKPSGNKKNDMISQTPSRNKKNKVVQIVLWYLDSGCSKHMTGNRSQLMNFVSKFLGTVRFGNDQIARIMGYGDYQLGNVIISRVYYVEGLGHNLFSVGQFCDADLEVAFQKNTCFIRNLEGVDLLSGSRDINLYTISLDDMLKSSPICLLSKASKTKSWLWHRRLSHLNFGTLNKLAKDGLA
ncbi:retrovirus-related pol polyprotein from transposon TNT 1-94 [Tanacetum coccineum]